MDTQLALGMVVGVVGLALVSVGLLAGRSRQSNAATSYLGSLADDAPPDLFSERLARPFIDRVFQPLVGRITSVTSFITPSDHRVRIRTALAHAGLDVLRRPEEVIALQVLGGLAGLAAGVAFILTGLVSNVTGIAITVVLVAAGVVAPMAWLSRKVETRKKAILADLPDTLDLLAISVEAGVGLEGAMEVVAQRFDSPLADELERTLQEMGLGLTRRDALTNLKQRSHVTELSTFVQALIQADLLGMPIGRVLKTQATDMRLRRRQYARERAAKLPVKVLLPLVFCIFPAVLVIILGPAMSEIGKAF